MKRIQKSHTRQAKIICTIGPASESPRILGELMRRGMNVARLNFSHGNHREHRQRILSIRALNRAGGFKVKILQDLEGYRIRVHALPGAKEMILKKGQTVFLTNQPGPVAANVIAFDYAGALTGIRPGMHIYIDDGNIALLVRSGSRTRLKAIVSVGGIVKERKGINIPQFQIPFEGLTEKDKKDLDFGIKNGVEYIAQSFVRKRQDIQHVIDWVRPKAPGTKIIAKIENRQGIDNIDDILMATDGIMVARGDMGISVPIYQIPVIQKMIIKKCNEKKKFVITATQMLESMTKRPLPTRAEVTDVANAILDGSDFLMLSAETAVGEYPAEVVRMMDQVICFTEQSEIKRIQESR